MMTLALIAMTLAAPAQPVAVVEMFTSQGCSSCPPADAEIRRLARAGASSGVEVIPLAFHVDYWNYIGWRDPFSSPQWTERQRSYAQVLPSSVYTPQAVIQGRSHEVGSRGAALRNAIKNNAYRGPRTLKASAERVGKSIRVTVNGKKRAGSELVVFLTESGIETAVKRGENRGRDLRNDAIVRATHSESIDGQGDFQKTVNFPLERGWDGTFRVVALWQDPIGRLIGDATQTRVR